jgi:hypothetical protein
MEIVIPLINCGIVASNYFTNLGAKQVVSLSNTTIGGKTKGIG